MHHSERGRPALNDCYIHFYLLAALNKRLLPEIEAHVAVKVALKIAQGMR